MKKKIAILATYVGEVDRGAETFVIELTKKLKYKYDITVFSKSICSGISDNTVKVKFNLPFWYGLHRKLYSGINIYRRICERIYYLIPGEIEQYYFSRAVYNNYLLKGNYSLIFPNNGVWGARAASKLRKLKDTPFIYTGHGGIGTGEIKIMKFSPNAYIALSESNKNQAEQYCNSVVKIYNGVTPESFSSGKEVKQEHSNLEKPVILCVGAFNDMKRQKLLVDAFALMKKGFLILLGVGENRKNIEKYCSEKIEGRYLVSDVNYKEINYYYDLCDIFSLPSKDEPFGIVYLEAMSADKPVVTTDDETRREVIGDAGILCDVENAEEYAESLERCFNIEWGNIPSERVKKCFSWDKIAMDYENVIEKITGK
jgi:glycosyltransferase involved in cell wall biosynthesis